MAKNKDEIRVMIDVEILSALDGYCNGAGKCRTEVVKSLIESFVKSKVHVAIKVLNAARINPMDVDTYWIDK